MSSKLGNNPIVPKCYDCDKYSDKQKTIFFAIGRAIVSLVSLALSATFLNSSILKSEFVVDYHRANTIRSILIVVCVENFLHFIVATFIVLLTRSNIGKPRSIKIWFIIDLALCTIYILCILILLFTIPLRKLFLIVGTILIILSVFLAYRSSVMYVIYKSDDENF